MTPNKYKEAVYMNKNATATKVTEDINVKDNIVYATATTNWYRLDTYKTTLPCKNRIKTALRALMKGEVEIVWQVPSNKKRKGLYLTPNKERV